MSHSAGLPHHSALLHPDLHNMMNVTLTISGERIHVPRSVIEKRCPALFENEELIKRKKEKKVPAGSMTIDYKPNIFSTVVFHRILEYCYTGTLPLEEMKIDEVLVLLKAVSKISCPRLLYLLEMRFREELNVDSVFHILKKTTELGLEEEKKVCTSFAHQNWPQFCANKAGMEIIGIELFQEITVAMQFYKEEDKIDARPEALPIVPCTIVGDFKSIFREANYAEGEFIFPGEEGAKSLKFHRCIVAAHTKPLHHFISSGKNKQYTIEGLSYSAVRDILKYIYYGEENFDPVAACEIVENGITQFSLQHLLDGCVKAISNGIHQESALKILRLTYLPAFQTETMDFLRAKVLDFVCANFKMIDVPSVRDMKPADIAHEMNADILGAIYYGGGIDSARNRASVRMTLPVDSKEASKKKRRKTARTLSTGITREEKEKHTTRKLSFKK